MLYLMKFIVIILELNFLLKIVFDIFVFFNDVMLYEVY